MSNPFKIFLSPPHMSGHELDFIKEVFASNYIAPLGPMVDRFEKEICTYTGYKHAVALSSGTAALHLALLSLGIQSGDPIWASTFTFIGSVSPITFCNAIPSFIDSSLTDWNIDLDLLEESLLEAQKHGSPPKALIVTDLYGQTCDYDRLMKICESFNVTLISDAAESLGASYKTSRCSPPIATFSFNGNKIITTSGGGILVAHDKRITDYARFLSQQARDPFPYYHHTVIGQNYRMSNVLAAIGVGQLEVLDDRVATKKRIYTYYKKHLEVIPGIKLMPIPEYSQPNYWLTTLTIDPLTGVTPDDIILALGKAQIESRRLWKPMHLQPVFSHAKVYGGSVSEVLFNTGLCLPSGSMLTTEDQDHIIEIIQKVMGK